VTGGGEGATPEWRDDAPAVGETPQKSRIAAGVRRLGDRRLSAARELLPGLALGGQRMMSSLSPLVLAVVLGALLANLDLVPPAAVPGVHFASRRLLRLGVVLLGFRVALPEIARLGASTLIVVVTVVLLTFAGTRWLGRRLGLSSGLSLLVATGFSICGASAVVAMNGLAKAEDEDVAYAIALVTVFGTLAMVVLPLLQALLGLEAFAFGQWVGASVHDVAQVVATSAAVGEEAMQTAIVVKLTRVVMLAPLIVGVGLGAASRTAGKVAATRILPLFVVGFLVAAAVRSAGLLSGSHLAVVQQWETLLFTAALVALGAGVRLKEFRSVGGRPLLLGFLSWSLIAAVSYAGIVTVGRL
jgi:uncharacterized integral membrane protein (TIGR00698 family)